MEDADCVNVKQPDLSNDHSGRVKPLWDYRSYVQQGYRCIFYRWVVVTVRSSGRTKKNRHVRNREPRIPKKFSISYPYPDTPVLPHFFIGSNSLRCGALRRYRPFTGSLFVTPSTEKGKPTQTSTSFLLHYCCEIRRSTVYAFVLPRSQAESYAYAAVPHIALQQWSWYLIAPNAKTIY